MINLKIKILLLNVKTKVLTLEQILDFFRWVLVRRKVHCKKSLK